MIAGRDDRSGPIPMGYEAWVPPARATRPRPRSRFRLGIVGAVVAALVTGAAAGGVRYLTASKSVALPVPAKLLPPQTSEISTQLIEATREPDEGVRHSYLAAELGSEICLPGQENPAFKIEEIGSKSSRAAKELFLDKKRLADTGKLLECGALLGGSLASPYQAVVSFDDNDKRHRVAIGRFNATEIPESEGFTPYSYRGIGGFCRTDTRPGAGIGSLDASRDKSCDAFDHGAFRQDQLWFLGSRTALEAMAGSVKRPREELTTRIADLEEAAQQTRGLPAVHTEAGPKSTREYLSAPCYYGAYHTAGSPLSFMLGCFPSGKLERQLARIDAKVKAAAYETDSDPQKARGFKGNVVLVTRDEDGAKTVEADVKELVEEWKQHLEENHARLINDAQRLAVTTRQKKFAVVADAYFQSLAKSAIERTGRTVRVKFNQDLSDGEVAALEDTDQSTVNKRRAVAQILDALQAKQPVPQAALTTLIGAPWATYLTAKAQSQTGSQSQSTAPVAPQRTPLTPGECKSLQARIAKFSSRNPAIVRSGAAGMLAQHKRASCNKTPPEVDPVQRACLSSFTKPAQYAACLPQPSNATAVIAAANVGPVEPPESAYGEPKR